MKDMVPKGTGNSRFLRSSIAADITHEELVALLRSGKFPVDFAGLNSAGIQVQGSAYNKGNVLPDAVCNRLDIPTSSEPKDAFLSLSNKGGWKEIARITTSKTWTVPTGVTQIGVLAIGGGESGNIALIRRNFSETENITIGGFSGHVTSAILDVSAGQRFNAIIGSGGQWVSSVPYEHGIGGETKFYKDSLLVSAKGAGVSVNGLYGGCGVISGIAGYISGQYIPVPEDMQVCGLHPGIFEYKKGAKQGYYYAFSEIPFLFSDLKILSPGGSISAQYTTDGRFQNMSSAPAFDLGELGKGGNSILFGHSDTDAEDATGYGNGGGSVLYYGNSYPSDIKVGKGCPGIVIIYA